MALLDLVKAFDGVPWDWLVLQASVHGYNLMLLRLSLAIYALARTIRIGSCYSRLLVARRGINAGAALATVELRVKLLRIPGPRQLHPIMRAHHCVRRRRGSRDLWIRDARSC